jgi:Tfp pilus assembly protein PilO
LAYEYKAPLFCPLPNATFDYSQAAIVRVLEADAMQSSTLISGGPSTEIPVLIRTAGEYVQAMARVLPVDAEADRLVDPLFSAEPTRRRSIVRR